jgi:hypothetical protein
MSLVSRFACPHVARVWIIILLCKSIACNIISYHDENCYVHSDSGTNVYFDMDLLFVTCTLRKCLNSYENLSPLVDFDKKNHRKCPL